MNNIILITAVALFLEVGTISATQRAVPGSYATILAAMSDAQTGDTIAIANGTYNEAVVVNKSVTLLGASSLVVITPPSGAGITVSASNVRLQSLRVTHATSNGIFASNVTNLSLINAGADSNNISGAQLTNVTGTSVVTNFTALGNKIHGLSIGAGSANITINGGTFNGNGTGRADGTGGGINLNASGGSLISNISIQGPLTASNNTTVGVWANGASSTDTIKTVTIGATGTITLTNNGGAGVIVSGNVKDATVTGNFTKGAATAAGILIVGVDFFGSSSPINTTIKRCNFNIGYLPEQPAITLSAPEVYRLSVNAVYADSNIFGGASTARAIEDLIYHYPDDIVDGLGLVTHTHDNPLPVGFTSFAATPDSLDFGTLVRNTSKTDTIVVSNGGNIPLVIDSVRSPNPAFTVSPSNVSIAAGSTADFFFTFKPADAGAKSAKVVFYSNGQTQPDTVYVKGDVVIAPIFSASKSTFDFGPVFLGKQKTDSVTVTNAGTSSLVISSVAPTDTAYTITPTSATLAIDEAQKFTITFAPKVAGMRKASIVVTSNVPEIRDTLKVTGFGATSVSIAEARKDVDNNLIPDHSVTKDTLVVHGIVTSPYLQSLGGQTAIFIQDSTAGIEIFAYSLPPVTLAIGDSVFVIGTVTQYRGATEFTPLVMDSLHFGILKHNAVVPKPRHLTLHQYVTNAESYEGLLVEIDTLYKASGTWPTANTYASIYLTNRSQADTAQMFISSSTNIPGSVEPAYPINVVAIINQYSTGSTVYNNGYEIEPRDTNDISKTKMAPSVSIAEARKDANSDFIADHSTTHDTLAVHGVITSPNFDPGQTVYALQDTTAGIIIVSSSPSPTSFVIGDSVVVVGTVVQDRGLVQFWPLAVKLEYFGLVKHDAVVPKAKRLTLHQFVTNGENYEGQLIEIDTLYKVSGTWPALGADANIYFSKLPKTDSVRMYIDMDTHIDGTTELQYPINVVGIAGQFTSAANVYNDGYEIVPRDTFDIHHQTVVSVRDPYSGIPSVYELHNNYPNPFNPSTTILYGLPQQSRVTLKIYSVLGQEVMTLVNDVQSPSYYRVVWNGMDKGGAQVSSGIYFFRLVAQSTDGKMQPFVQVMKMMLMK